MTINELKDLLNAFLERWTVDNVRHMTLQEYVGVGNRDTFCQWVETKTRMLGSIKGFSSIKFGIYERKNPSKKPKNYQNDDKYSWRKNYGANRKEAFENVKRDILRIIDLAERGKFKEIDSIPLHDFFKWKVAFLYSNERLIPIYKREVLNKIAKHFGLSVNNDTTVSEIQDVMVSNKPAHLNVYEFMRKLYSQFGDAKDKDEIVGRGRGEKRSTRKAATTRNTDTQSRKGGRSYIADQKHNKIQLSLMKKLIGQYQKENVILEKNFVDVKVIQPDCIHLYEVKSHSYASDCMADALGQILWYAFNDSDTRPKKLFVVGQYEPTNNDKRYINFIKQNLKLDIDYCPIGLE
jgi:hypothetical protein